MGSQICKLGLTGALISAGTLGGLAYMDHQTNHTISNPPPIIREFRELDEYPAVVRYKELQRGILPHSSIDKLLTAPVETGEEIIAKVQRYIQLDNELGHSGRNSIKYGWVDVVKKGKRDVVDYILELLFYATAGGSFLYFLNDTFKKHKK